MTNNIDTLAKKFLRINEEFYNKAKNPLRSHGPDHHWRVWKVAEKIAQVYKNKIDWEVLVAACLLHDISAYYPDEVGDNYHEEDPKRAKRILEEVKFSSDKISRVIDAIEAHGSGTEYKEKRDSLESVILCDADKLDIFGPLGIARIIMVRTLRGDGLQDIVKDFWDEGHLQRKWDAITLDETKKIGHKDYEYTMCFFKEFSKRLKR